MPEIDEISLDMAQQIEQDIRKFDNHLIKTDSIRAKIIGKLETAVDQLTLDPDKENFKAVEAKMNIINSLMKALNDSESSKISGINLKQKSKNDKEQEDTLKTISRTVAEYAKKIDISSAIFGRMSNSTSEETTSSSSIDEKFDQVVVQEGIEATDGELSFTSTSAKDIERDDIKPSEET